MKCRDCLEKLYKFMDRDLDLSLWKDVEFHLKSCRPCWSRYEFEVRLKERLKSSCPIEACTEKLRARIKSILDRF